MTCPKCKNEQHCPCKNCAKDNAGKVTWKWDKTGEIISCGWCGEAMTGVRVTLSLLVGAIIYVALAFAVWILAWLLTP